MPRGNTDILNFVCACLKIQCHTKNKKQKNKKNKQTNWKAYKKPCAFTIISYILRFLRDELPVFAVWTESDNFHSLQSLLWIKLTSVPKRSTVFGQASDDNY